MLRERQFGCREDRDRFYAQVKKTHKDVIRGTDQDADRDSPSYGLVVWWVRYGEPTLRDALIAAAARAFAPESQITLEQEKTSNGVEETPQDETMLRQKALPVAAKGESSGLYPEEETT